MTAYDRQLRVLALLVGLGALAGCGSPATAPTGPATSVPEGAAAPTFDHGLWVEPAPGDCPKLNRVFDPDAAPPIDDLVEQQALARRLPRGESYAVRYTRPTALGLAVLVSGDLAAAKAALAAVGVTLVGGYGDQDDLDQGIDPVYEVQGLVAERILPAEDLVLERTRGLSGSGGMAGWPDAGGVLLQWRQPVPSQVQALDQVRTASGARIVVVGVRYSEAELGRALDRLMSVVRRDGTRFAEAGSCGDASGLAVGVPPALMERQGDTLRRRWTAVAGVPVTVYPQAVGGQLD